MDEFTNCFFDGFQKVSEIYYVPTDFETLCFEEEELVEKIKILNNNEIVLFRMIDKKMLDRYFNSQQEGQDMIDKYFFLPSHKVAEIKKSLKEDNNKGYPEDLKEYYTEDMYEKSNPSKKFYHGQQFNEILVQSSSRKYHSTSLFMLINHDKITQDLVSQQDNIVSEENYLKFSDLSELNNEQVNQKLLSYGLEICQLTPLYDHLVAVGTLNASDSILVWEGKKGKGSQTHIDTFKVRETPEQNITYQNIANKFRIVDLKISVKRRRNSKRR